MSLETPDKIRKLQRKLYEKAKAEPKFRFYQLYDKIYREDILAHAYDVARSKGGAAGVDGVTFEAIEAQGLQDWLRTLQEELHANTYRPQPVRRVLFPKPGGGKRPLGIPTIRDRVVQTAVKLVLEPIFEADFEDCAFGYRPKRSATDAIERAHKALCRGYTDVVDADLSRYFDTIPHHDLMQSVARRVVDRQMLKLIKSWLKAPVEERGPGGKRFMKSGRDSASGTPQGGVLSPLLANIYMHRFLRHWRRKGKGREYDALVVNYADDFVILSRGHAAQALEWTRTVMSAIGLTLNEAKTTLRDARHETFDFLGYTLGPERFRKDGRRYLAAKPSRKSVQRLRGKVRRILHRGNQSPWPEVRDALNRLLRGWANYFSYGTLLMAYRAVDNHVYNRVRGFLRRRHKVPSRGTRRFPAAVVFGERGVLRMRRLHLGPAVRPS